MRHRTELYCGMENKNQLKSYFLRNVTRGRYLLQLKIQATVTPRFTIHVTVTPLRVASFFQETSAPTRLS